MFFSTLQKITVGGFVNHLIKNSGLNNNVKFRWSMSSDILKINQRSYKIICLTQYFEADFLYKVSLKILNSRIMLITLTIILLTREFMAHIMLIFLVVAN